MTLAGRTYWQRLVDTPFSGKRKANASAGSGVSTERCVEENVVDAQVLEEVVASMLTNRIRVWQGRRRHARSP